VLGGCCGSGIGKVVRSGAVGTAEIAASV
jgi:hypothetical protein